MSDTVETLDGASARPPTSLQRRPAGHLDEWPDCGRGLGRGRPRHGRAARCCPLGQRQPVREHHERRRLGVGCARFRRPASRPFGGRGFTHYGPWLIAIGVWFTLWELTTAKFGWLPKPFFSPPNGLLNVYVTEAPRLLICIGYTLRLWSLGFAVGVPSATRSASRSVGRSDSAIGACQSCKLIGPVPATAWIPVHVLFLSDDLRRERLHRRAGVGNSGDDPHLVRRRLGQSRLLRRRPQSRRERMVSHFEDRRARPLCRTSSSACSWVSTIRSRSSS